jgi:hypothetical protein
MANGKKGDHPITDIVDWGLEVYGEPIDSLIKQLFEDGRGYELTTEIAFWNGVSSVEIEGQLRAMAKRRPSARVEFHFEPKVAGRYGSPGHGWVFRGAVQFVDPDVALEQTWTVLFWPDPFHFEDGRIVATARPTSDDAPPRLLAPGRDFWIRRDTTKLAHGRVFPEGAIPI